MMCLLLHVTCSCIFHACILFLLSILNLCCVSIRSFFLSLSLSLSLIEPPYGTQTEEIDSSSKPLPWFWVILFCSSSCSISYSVLWWECQDELLWELLGMWCSSEMPGYSVGFCWHSSTWSHSDSRLGISTWEIHEVSRRVYSGVLLQHTWHRYLCASVCFYIQRYTYHSYSGSYIRGTTHP